jgi:hypothetical protein
VLQIFLLLITTGGIAAYSRGRGGNPWLWGSLSVVGHLLIQFLGGLALGIMGRQSTENGLLAITIASWVWVGIVAFCARFLLGMGMEKPEGMWSCKNCKYLNQRYAVICEACREPYGKKA